ncbi:hypothetical protein Ppa06_64810 [Planomonospora parontospora subsp. parontospora]|uniref:Uncharacterized protein n=2 Tax=Planomonospora parontospora TaxID=58119 RepID=A0AA37BMG1_9ACTN|nr:hypothetical protein [Planomonospora parontospora]GGK94365.1 hypothetical protein GCM10010126_62270 [Planomonospora parontospora]GII12683.1 hypothetical protein Ppa06_64810 [Planomonospora parontospora subsp. parontospora]
MSVATLGALVALLVLFPLPVATLVAVFSRRKHRQAMKVLHLLVFAFIEIIRRKKM